MEIRNDEELGKVTGGTRGRYSDLPKDGIRGVRTNWLKECHYYGKFAEYTETDSLRDNSIVYVVDKNYLLKEAEVKIGELKIFYHSWTIENCLPYFISMEKLMEEYPYELNLAP